MRHFIYFSYDGTAYHGWQRQPNALTVQEKLDGALSTLLRTNVQTVGAGRTDTGVHAHRMVAHFDADVPDAAQLCYRLNAMLPADIAVQRIEPVSEEMHARFSAKSRTYHYYVCTSKNPFQRHYAARFHFQLDFQLMNKAARLLLSTSDFTSFSRLHTDVKTNTCHVMRALWTQQEPDLWRFEITADRFLRGMVRAIVGTLIDVGRGRLSIAGMQQIIQRKDRCAAADAAPPNALFLVDVAY